jgi:hypothetical protein
MGEARWLTALEHWHCAALRESAPEKGGSNEQTTADSGRAADGGRPRGTHRAYIVLGLVQGLALWALYHSVGNRPGPIGPAFAAVLQFSLAGPLAWYLSAASFGSARARAGVAVLVGSLLAALGVHAGATGDALGFDRIVASLVLGYVIVALAAGVAMPRLKRASSRTRPSIWSRTRRAQMSLSLNGAFCPTSLPLFHGSRETTLPGVPMMVSHRVKGHAGCARATPGRQL